MEPIYSILSNETIENHLKFKIELNASHSIYKGHFPNMPIVPGVVLLQMVKELLESSLRKKLQLKEASNIKFLKMVLPKEVEDLEIELVVEEGESIKVKAEIRKGGDVYCKMGLVYSFSILDEDTL